MSKAKLGKARINALKKGPDKLEDEEMISKLELEKENLIQQLHKRQVEVREALSRAKKEECKIKEYRERKTKIRTDHNDMYAILPRIFLHEETAFKIHLTAVFKERKQLNDELVALQNDLQKWIKANNELQKQIEDEIQLGKTRIAALHIRYPDVFETVMKKITKTIHQTLDEEFAHKGDELHRTLKTQLVQKIPLLPPSKY